MSARLESIGRHIDIDNGRGLEIGPLDRPVIQRVEGRDIAYADHQGPDALIERWGYEQRGHTGEAPGLDLVPLDFRVNSVDMSGPPEGEFDYIVASHVLEHLPDPIRWLAGATRLLKPGGHLWLALPNRHYTFDLLRPPSTAGDWLQAYHQRRTMPDIKAVFDSERWTATVSEADVEALWLGKRGEQVAAARRRVAGIKVDAGRIDRAMHDYTDVHCTIVDEIELLEILIDITRLELLSLSLVDLVLTPIGSIEFYCVLRNEEEATREVRLSRLEKQYAELVETRQTDPTVDGVRLSRSRLLRLLLRSVRDKGFKF